jgi:hypothetical protein
MAKNILTIYEGAMCCSTGVCGPEPDKELIEFNQTLKKLQGEFKELNVTRANMSFNIRMFLENKQIFKLIKEDGPEMLPIITLNGNIISKQKYLTYEELKNEVRKLGVT